ncbi:MAG: Gfo/Idh/MocA family oxidoreductase [Erythrobacter sp.]|nr:Gfo/Idh/MocA family oxidoreductase [Erythrobacter sp.]
MTYKVLIIGCGAIAGGYDADREGEFTPTDLPLSHAGAIQMHDRFELAACVDPDRDTRGAFAERWGVPVDEPDLTALGGEVDAFDVIVVASPTQNHAEHLEWALAVKPKAVLCEKPMAQDYAQSVHLADAYRSAAIPLCVNYTRRWSLSLGSIAGEIEAGEYGELISGVGTYTKGIVHNGGHMVDLLRFLIGDVAVHSIGPARLDHWDHDPTASAILTAGNGAPIHLVAGDARLVTQFELVLNFETCQFAMRDGGRRIEFRNTGPSDTYAGYREYGLPESNQSENAGAMWSLYQMLADSIEFGVPLISDAESALAAQSICEEIRLKALETLKKDPE